jgi:serine/threonine protein phosphatase PrpC
MAVYDGHGPAGGDCARYACKKLPALLSKNIVEARERKSQHRTNGTGEAMDASETKDVTAGAVASKTANNNRRDDTPSPPELTPEEVRSCIHTSYVETNAALHRSIMVEDQLSGTTAIGILFHEGHMTVANCGDSRAILGRKRQPSDPSIELATLRYQKCSTDFASVVDGTLSSRDPPPAGESTTEWAFELDNHGGPPEESESTTAWALDLDHERPPEESESSALGPGLNDDESATDPSESMAARDLDDHGPLPDASDYTAWRLDLDDPRMMIPDESDSTDWRLDLDDHGMMTPDASESTAWRLDLDDAEPPRIEPVEPAVVKKPVTYPDKNVSSEHPFDEQKPVPGASTTSSIPSAESNRAPRLLPVNNDDAIRTTGSFGIGRPSDEESVNEVTGEVRETTNTDFSKHADPAVETNYDMTPHLDEALAVAQGLTALVHGKVEDTNVMDTLKGLSDLMDEHETREQEQAGAAVAAAATVGDRTEVTGESSSEAVTRAAEETAVNDGETQSSVTTAGNLTGSECANADETTVDVTGVTVGADVESNLLAANAGNCSAEETASVDAKSQLSFVALPLSRDQTPWRKDERDRVKEAGACVWSIDQIEGRVPFHDEWGDSFEGDTTQDFYQDPPRLWIAGKDYPGTAFTRSIGDWLAESVGVIADPEMLTLELTCNDQILVIASDGVFEFLTNQEVIDICAQCQSPLEACGKIVQAAYDQWFVYETRADDISVIVCFMKCSCPPMEDGRGTSEELMDLVDKYNANVALTHSQKARYARGISIGPLSDGVSPSVEEALADLNRDNPLILRDGSCAMDEEGSC